MGATQYPSCIIGGIQIQSPCRNKTLLPQASNNNSFLPRFDCPTRAFHTFSLSLVSFFLPNIAAKEAYKSI